MVTRFNDMHPQEKPLESFVTKQLKGRQGPVIAVSDYIRLYADQIRPYVPARYLTLGTDGYGRSDTREQLRHFFEVDAKYIVLTTLHALRAEGTIDAATVLDAFKRYQIDPDKLDPWTH